ncbi:hypothetical protein O1611_g5733 [Lasiodiplodia mahajangana]|uniref:Uncharacterized protein n=1 Tax=Lasiodiplodia mahajangana TaxID=1108764 RepID=A0ACC2JKX8_9PEZI|nr:hypothetical protein O1611_g5733 [Lasiodiplodia mahajangana]
MLPSTDATTAGQRANENQFATVAVHRENEAQLIATTARHEAEAHATMRRRASRRRVFILISIAVATIIVTALAMEAAGCTYDDIKGPITTRITIFTIFLTPTYTGALT